jgi:hypothetical protein
MLRVDTKSRLHLRLLSIFSTSVLCRSPGNTKWLSYFVDCILDNESNVSLKDSRQSYRSHHNNTVGMILRQYYIHVNFIACYWTNHFIAESLHQSYQLYKIGLHESIKVELRHIDKIPWLLEQVVQDAGSILAFSTFLHCALSTSETQMIPAVSMRLQFYLPRARFFHGRFEPGKQDAAAEPAFDPIFSLLQRDFCRFQVTYAANSRRRCRHRCIEVNSTRLYADEKKMNIS